MEDFDGTWNTHPSRNIDRPEHEPPYIDVDPRQQRQPCQTNEDSSCCQSCYLACTNDESPQVEIAWKVSIGWHVVAVLLVKDERMIAELAILFAGMLKPFDETVLMAKANGAGTFAGIVQRSTRLRPATADTTRILVLHLSLACEELPELGQGDHAYASGAIRFA